MIEKIKAFLQNKTVRLIAAILVVVGSAILIFGGTAPSVIEDLIVKVAAIVAAVIAVITLILDIVDPAPKVVNEIKE